MADPATPGAPTAQPTPIRPLETPAQRAAYGRMRLLVQAALVVLTGFMASRVLGVVRSMVVAAQFDPLQPEYNAYLAAIRVPDLVYQVLVGGAVGSAFIPVFKNYLTKHQESQAWRLTSSVINLSMLVTGGVAIVLAIFAEQVMGLAVPGQNQEFRQLSASLARILLIAPAIFAVSTFCASVLNSYQRFAVAALAPLMYNLAIIIGALTLSGPFGIHGLAVAAVLGAVLHFLVQVPSLVKLGMQWRPVIDLRMEGVREVGRLFAPRFVGLGVVQLNQLLSAVVLASFLAVGSMAFLDYAWLMVMTPLALAMAVGTATFPTLTEQMALGNRSEMQRVFSLSLRTILFLTIPAAVGLMVIGEPVIRLFFERGQFGPAATKGTAYALAFYAIGLAGHATIEIVDRVFYALHDTRTPVYAAVGAIALNIVLSLILMRTELSYGGLALANSLAALVEAAVLLALIARRMPSFNLAPLSTSMLRNLAASLVMGLPIAWLAQWLDPVLAPMGLPGHIAQVVACAAVGAGVYGVVSYLFQSEELGTILRILRR